MTIRLPHLRRPRNVRRPRIRLSLRTRLAVLCLGIAVLSGGLLMAGMNILISVELVQRYSTARPVFTGDRDAPTDKVLAEIHAANDRSDDLARTIRLYSLAGFGVLTALAGVACWYLSGRALRPVRQITGVASRLSQDTLDERIGYTGARDELHTLADSFDAMLDRLTRSFDSQRLFVANASHELRGPLTVIRTAADVTLARPTRPEIDYRRALAIIDTAAQRSQRLLDSLLQLARTQHHLANREPLDLADTAASSATAVDLHSDLHLRLELAPAPLSGDPNLIELLLRNLIENAVRYNVPAGWIAIRTLTDPGHAILEVENTGPAIDHEQTGNLVRPFQRGHQTRTFTSAHDGFGLGLAIVDAIAHAHDGRLTITPRPEGGLLVTVAIPT